MNYAVIGLGFGDEGKGLVTNYLCLQNPNSLNVRYSGGQQAGHTVVKDDIRHVFSTFGSGSLNSIPTHLYKTCTFDPEGALAELKILNAKGCNPVLSIDPDCPITTPYEKLHGRFYYKEFGTCGCGVGSTWEREENFYSLKARDLEFPSIFKIKLELLKKYYKRNINLDDFIKYCFEIEESIKIIDFFDNNWWYKNVIFEGSQGILLDKNIGFFPHVTWSNTGLQGIPDDVNNIYFVTRAYQTRHGNGPMTNENIPHKIIENPLETNITNEYQGNFRKSLLDLDLLEYSLSTQIQYLSKARNINLVITCLDQIKNDLRFTYEGKIIQCESINDFITKVFTILRIEKGLLSYSDKSELLETFYI